MDQRIEECDSKKLLPYLLEYDIPRGYDITCGDPNIVQAGPSCHDFVGSRTRDTLEKARNALEKYSQAEVSLREILQTKKIVVMPKVPKQP
ncbi:hypothetical protein JTE90_024822 [Oedothorax gibbosus]|uniref:Uncharacterized protein n=1 Tax=Oedothorax gibbosus TaxID=931172 RepID=A0AAV6TDH9_9ARAC|nr:hypothetical protein JTE90_024822 [Oedothorax gibbosus]